MVVRGKKDGEAREYRMHGVSREQGLGEGTGYPAAVGAILMQQGKAEGKGVLPPEGCIKPRDFFDLFIPLTGMKAKGGDDSADTSFILEVMDEAGNVEPFELF